MISSSANGMTNQAPSNTNLSDIAMARNDTMATNSNIPRRLSDRLGLISKVQSVTESQFAMTKENPSQIYARRRYSACYSASFGFMPKILPDSKIKYFSMTFVNFMEEFSRFYVCQNKDFILIRDINHL